MLNATTVVLLAVGVLVVLVAVGAAPNSIHRRRAARRLLAEGIALAQDGRQQDALAALVKAESAWAFNVEQGSRASAFRDLELLSAITAEILKLLPASEKERLAPNVGDAIPQLRQLFGERANFRIDGRVGEREPHLFSVGAVSSPA